ncbi:MULTISPECIES: hypothetical protein [Cysteiniphilum]|uniref:IcmF-related N-terminal domain-containing protein n=1 Tax=Cysteiniphilum litorale TaxID=2056700 RepID=A0A8J2Z2U7_9GAMM|nr:MULTISPECIES: hypothetical protein [Cysteiniphilum]GGF90968.1 hypothetical protein GCM10010995_05330 [Cysteiniphilum litorale]
MHYILQFIKAYAVHFIILAIVLAVFIYLIKKKPFIFKYIWRYISNAWRARLSSILVNNAYYRFYKSFSANASGINAIKHISQQPYVVINLCQDDFVEAETGLGTLISGVQELSADGAYRYSIAEQFFVHELLDIDRCNINELGQFWRYMHRKYQKPPVVVIHFAKENISQKMASLLSSILTVIGSHAVTYSLSTKSVSHFSDYMELSLKSGAHPLDTLLIDSAELVHSSLKKQILEPLAKDSNILSRATDNSYQKLNDIIIYLSQVEMSLADVAGFCSQITNNVRQRDDIVSIFYLAHYRASLDQHIFILNLEKSQLNSEYSKKVLAGLSLGLVGFAISGAAIAVAVSYQTNLKQFSAEISSDPDLTIAQIGARYQAYMAQNTEALEFLLPERYEMVGLSEVSSRYYLDQVLESIKAQTSFKNIVLLYYFFNSDDGVSRKLIVDNLDLFSSMIKVDKSVLKTLALYPVKLNASERGILANLLTQNTEHDEATSTNTVYFNYLIHAHAVSLNDWKSYIAKEFLPIEKENLIAKLVHSDGKTAQAIEEITGISFDHKKQLAFSEYQSSLEKLFKSGDFSDVFATPDEISLESITQSLLSTEKVAEVLLNTGDQSDHTIGMSIIKAKLNTLSSMLAQANSYAVVAKDDHLGDITFEGIKIPVIYTKVGVDNYVTNLNSEYTAAVTKLKDIANMSVFTSWQNEVMAHYITAYQNVYNHTLQTLLSPDSALATLGGLKIYLNQVDNMQYWQLISEFFSENTNAIDTKNLPQLQLIKSNFSGLNQFIGNVGQLQAYLGVINAMRQDISSNDQSIVKIAEDIVHSRPGSYRVLLENTLVKANLDESTRQKLSLPVNVTLNTGLLTLKQMLADQWQDFVSNDLLSLQNSFPFAIHASSVISTAQLYNLLINPSSNYQQYIKALSEIMAAKDGQFNCDNSNDSVCVLSKQQLSATNQLQSVIALLWQKGNYQPLHLNLKLGDHPDDIASGGKVKFSFVALNDVYNYGVNADIGWIDTVVQWWKPVRFQIGVILTDGQTVKYEHTYDNLFALLLDYVQNAQSGVWQVNIPHAHVQVGLSVEVNSLLSQYHV